jgi:hypothetical protein
MKNFYVTKKQVKEFIDKETKRLKMSKKELLKEVNIVLNDLMEFPNDNKAQIKYYSRIKDSL